MLLTDHSVLYDAEANLLEKLAEWLIIIDRNSQADSWSWCLDVGIMKCDVFDKSDRGGKSDQAAFEQY